VEIYPGFAAQEALFDENGVVRGIITGDLGVDREGNPKEGLYTPGMELRGKYTLFAEGCRGHIGKQLIKRFNLDSDADAQHYGIGLKEIWEIDPAKHSQAWWCTPPAGRWTSWAPKTPAARSSITWKTTRWWSA
jgi:electron-transferring-flavoprotein dehydrogenase